MPVTLEEADVRAAIRILKTLFGVPIQDDVAAHVHTQALIHQLIQKVDTMSDNVNAKFDAQDQKIDQLVTSVGSLEQRVAAQDAKLTAAQTERDAAVADLATTKQALTDAQAQLAAIPQVDTAALEARLQAEADKVDGVIGRLNAIDAAPVPAPAPDAPTGSGSEADTGAAQAPAPTPDASTPAAPAPDASNTGMPTGTVTNL